MRGQKSRERVKKTGEGSQKEEASKEQGEASKEQEIFASSGSESAELLEAIRGGAECALVLLYNQAPLESGEPQNFRRSEALRGGHHGLFPKLFWVPFWVFCCEALWIFAMLLGKQNQSWKFCCKEFLTKSLDNFF